MGRDISSPMLASLLTNHVYLGFLAALTFRSGTRYVWTGSGNLSYGGNVYLGVGSLGKIGTISESSEVTADGTTVSLSGIDSTLLSECLTDIQLGAPAIIYFALFDANCNILGTPYPLFVGTVDQPEIEPGIEEMSIVLALENKLVNMQRASMRRYTAADQQLYYPGDTFFNWVEILNSLGLKWTA